MQTSTATSVFVNYTLPDAVDEIIAAGFDGVDLWCGRPHLFRQDYPPETVQRLRARLQETNTAVVSLMPAFFRYPFSLSSPLEAIRADSVQYMKDCIDHAVFFGAQHVLVVPTHSLRGQPQPEARALFIDSLRQVSGYAAPRGMKLGLEIVYPKLSDLVHSTQGALEILDAVGSDALGVVIDSGHLNLSGEDIEDALARLADRLLQVHINDNNGREQQNAVPGEGSFDFADFLARLHRHGYDGFLTLELGWGYSFDPVPPVQQALANLKSLLAGG